MSYLNDPRVFYAIERTLLAWMRTEIAILAFAFLMKKYGLDLAQESKVKGSLDFSLHFICGMVILMSIVSLVQCYVSISKLSEPELPSKYSKFSVLVTGIVGILLCVISSFVIFSV